MVGILNWMNPQLRGILGNNSNTLTGLGASLLQYSQNTAQPMNFQPLMQGVRGDQQNRQTAAQEAEKQKAKNLTQSWLLTQGLARDENEAAMITSDPVILNATLKKLERPESPKPTDDMREWDWAQGDPAKMEFLKRGGVNIDMGGGTDKQIFDSMMESTTSARAAVTGLNGIREARKAVEGGAILGAGADQRLALQKVGALIGVADPTIIQNTETFRSAIAPQVSAMMKATVGSTQISNADREFAEKAAGGSINLDAGSIKRLLGIMEKAGQTVVQSHRQRLQQVYPESGGFQRERAIMDVPIPDMSYSQPAQGGGSVVEDEAQIPEGATVRRDDGVLLVKRGGRLVPLSEQQY